MFSVIIKGRTMMELRTNLAIFLAGMDDFTVPSKVSQAAEMSLESEPEEEQSVTEVNISAHAAPFTMPHIPAHLAQAIAPEPARSIPSHLSQGPLTAPSVVPSVPASPSASTVASPTVPVGTVVSDEFGFDTKGLPWDSRIHAVTQGINKDGSWRYRRGVEDAYIETVEKELRSRMAGVHIPTPAQPVAPVMASPNPPPVPQAPQSPAASGLSMVPPLQQPAPVMAAVEPSVQVSAPVPPQNLSMHSLETFKANLPMTLAKLVMEGKLPQAYIQSLKEYFKVEQIWQVNAEQAAEMFETFCEAGVLVKV